SEFVRRYGKNGQNLLEASSLAGETPLILASDFDCGWDFTLYSEGMMALDTATKRVDYISVDRLIDQPPLDSDYVSIASFVKTTLSLKSFDRARIIPPQLALTLTTDCNKALELVNKINTNNNKALLYEIADIKTWANLGLHLAEKISGAIALEAYRVNGA